MKLLLFDLDGTLLTAGGIGRRSTRTALNRVFGTDGNLDEFYPGGRTQEAIFLDTLLDIGITRQEYLLKREELYRIFLEEFHADIQAGKHQISPLAGGIELIRLLREEHDVILGVITGNHSQNAQTKLEIAGYDPGWFSVGAYGEENADRSKLVPLAEKRAQEKNDLDVQWVQKAVIGDTTRDVISGKSVGAMTLALTTGTDDRSLLETTQPDYLLDGLADYYSVRDILLSPGTSN